MKQPPRLMQGALTGRIYVTTRYRAWGDDGGLESLEKFDVTDDFLLIEADRARAAKDQS